MFAKREINFRNPFSYNYNLNEDHENQNGCPDKNKFGESGRIDKPEEKK